MAFSRKIRSIFGEFYQNRFCDVAPRFALSLKKRFSMTQNRLKSGIWRLRTAKPDPPQRMIKSKRV
jgi:hypothetical protein